MCDIRCIAIAMTTMEEYLEAITPKAKVVKEDVEEDDDWDDDSW